MGGVPGQKTDANFRHVKKKRIFTRYILNNPFKS
jgi:hypothetical protein